MATNEKRKLKSDERRKRGREIKGGGKKKPGGKIIGDWWRRVSI